MWLPPISHFLGRLQGRIFFFSESTVLLAGGVAAPGLGPLARSGGRHRRHHHDPADGDVAHGEVPARMSPCPHVGSRWVPGQPTNPFREKGASLPSRKPGNFCW